MVVVGQLFLINNSFKNMDNREKFTGKEDKDNIPNECPNMLVKEDNKYYLYNTKKEQIPGVNPLVFNNLEEYVDFLKLKRSKNINCPILFLQQTYDTQGKPSFIIQPSPTELNGGLPHDTFTNYSVNRGNNSSVTPIMTPPIYTSNIVGGGGQAVGLGEAPSVSTIQNSDISLPLPDAQNKEIELNDASRQKPYFESNNYPGFDPSNQYIGVTTPLDKMFNQSGKSPNPMDTNWGGPEVTDKFVSERYKLDPYNQSIIKK